MTRVHDAHDGDVDISKHAATGVLPDMYTLVPETGSTSTSPTTGAASVLKSRVVFILLSWPPLQPCLVYFPMKDLHSFRPCPHYTGKLYMSTRSAIRYSMSSNSPDQEQVLHTHRMSCRNIWPKGFGPQKFLAQRSTESSSTTIHRNSRTIRPFRAPKNFEPTILQQKFPRLLELKNAWIPLSLL